MPPTKRLSKKVASATTRPSKRVAAPPPPDDDDDDDAADEEPAPRPSMKAPSKNGDAKIRGGWTEGQRQNDANSSFAKSWRPEERLTAIKFLEDAPYASFRRHWVDGVNDQGQKTTRAYTCPRSFDDTCPLCEIGHRTQSVNAFNIAVIGDDGQVLHRAWEVGVRVFNVLKSYSNDPKVMPLSRHFFLANKTGQKTNTQYNVSPIRAASLEEDYDIPAPDPADFARIELYDSSIVTVEPIKVLRELARELATDY
jgi:hypothetical protein